MEWGFGEHGEAFGRRKCVGYRWDKLKEQCSPLYLHELIFVRWKRLCLGSGGRPTRGVAKSPDAPPATTVDEHGTFAIVTHDRIVAWLQSHVQGRLP